MGKDREGKFHPRKGKPSGAQREGVGAVQPIDTNSLDERLEIENKYTDGEEKPAPNIYVRHPNRNVDKREERQRSRDTQRFSNPSNKSAKNEAFVVARGDVVAEEFPASLSKEQFAELANFVSERCISIYLTTNSSTSVEANRQKDSIVFKNKLQQLTALLKEKQVEQMEIERMLKPGYDLLGDESFFSGLSNGLAFFIADGYFKFIRLPIPPKEEMVANSSFYLTPLIPVITTRDYFYVLVLSKKQAKLYRADSFGMQYLSIPEMPNGVVDVVHFEEKDDQDLFRTDTSGAGAGATYHGMGAGRPDDKTNIAMYFDEVDETVWKEQLHDENVPLLLVGVEYLIPIYKQVAKYKPIWPEAITGSHEHEDINTLYQQVRAKMEPYFLERVTKALNAYGNQSATELTSSIPDDIIPAAHYGRIAQLFVLKDEHIWGRFDEMNNALDIHAIQEEGDECLVDKTVIKTLLNGGEVFMVPANKMPGGSKLAALMRY